jgi:hypothetical protein
MSPTCSSPLAPTSSASCTVLRASGSAKPKPPSPRPSLPYTFLKFAEPLVRPQTRTAEASTRCFTCSATDPSTDGQRITPGRGIHHGVAAVSVAGPEGPGAAMETTSALPLPHGMLFTMAKTEYVPFQQFAFAEPNNKSYSSFNMVAVGYGVRPWMSVYVFQPFNVKEQNGVGRSTGAGDTNLMLSFAFKWDGVLQLAPEKESLDDLMDWHFSAWASSTLPAGPTSALDDAGAYFAPDMQTGFGAPSPAVGVAVMKHSPATSPGSPRRATSTSSRTRTASRGTSSAGRRVSTRPRSTASTARANSGSTSPAS